MFYHLNLPGCDPIIEAFQPHVEVEGADIMRFYEPYAEGVMYYDKTGNLITLQKFQELFKDPDYRQVMQDRHQGVAVSTVWLGIDHNNIVSAANVPVPPLIFETMVFKNGTDQDCIRASTVQAAIDNHLMMKRKYGFPSLSGDMVRNTRFARLDLDE